MAPHVGGPAVLVVAAASMTAAGLALLGRHTGHVPGDGGPAEEPPADLVTALTALLGALGAGLTAAVAAQQVYATHLARTRRWEDKLAADAAAAVAAVGTEYVTPIRRERLGALLRAEPIEHCRPGLDEVQHLARIYSRWSLSLKLTEAEGEEAFERAVSALSDDYPRTGLELLAHEARKALAASKEPTPSTLAQLTDFISRVKPGSLQLVRGAATPPMSRSTTPA